MATLQLTPTYNGYSTSGPNGFVQTEVGGGMPRTQLDLVGGVSVVNLRFVLSEWQYQYWRAFYLGTITEGSLPFDMTLDVDGYDATYSVQIVKGTVAESRAYQTGIQVTFQVYARPIIDEDYMASVVDLYGAYGEAGSSLLEAIDQFANTDSQVLT